MSRLLSKFRSYLPAERHKAEAERRKAVSKAEKEARRRSGPLLRADGNIEGISLDLVVAAHRDVQVQLSHASTILGNMESLGKWQFIHTDMDYDKIHELPYDIYDFDQDEDRSRKDKKRSIIMSAISYSEHQRPMQDRVSNLLGGNSFRWRKLDSFMIPMSYQRNKNAHSYRTASNENLDAFTSEEFWENMCAWIPPIVEDLIDLEGCLYRTRLAIDGKEVTVKALQPPLQDKPDGNRGDTSTPRRSLREFKQDLVYRLAQSIEDRAARVKKGNDRWGREPINTSNELEGDDWGAQFNNASIGASPEEEAEESHDCKFACIECNRDFPGERDSTPPTNIGEDSEDTGNGYEEDKGAASLFSLQ